MNFIKLKKLPTPNIDEYVIINMDEVVKIKDLHGNFEICFNNKENNVTVENCEENRVKLGLQIGNDLIKDGLCNLNF